MQRAAQQMDGLSLHYYTVTGWSGSKGSATDFSTDDYYWTLGKCREIEDVINVILLLWINMIRRNV